MAALTTGITALFVANLALTSLPAGVLLAGALGLALIGAAIGTAIRALLSLAGLPNAAVGVTVGALLVGGLAVLAIGL